MIRVLVIDDERRAREEVKLHLSIYPDFDVVGEAENADEAEELIIKTRPDMLFLDIQMPERSGFDLLESLTYLPEIIFTTAFDHYAVQAFEANALDYLVKPIREERFTQAIDKFRLKYSEHPNRNTTLTAGQTIFIKDGDEYHFVQINDIYLIESMANYVRIFFCQKKVYLKRSLNQLEKLLDPLLFLRISRIHIINITYIRKIYSLPKGRLRISLEQGEPLTVSSRQTVAFKNKHIIL